MKSDTIINIIIAILMILMCVGIFMYVDYSKQKTIIKEVNITKECPEKICQDCVCNCQIQEQNTTEYIVPMYDDLSEDQIKYWKKNLLNYVGEEDCFIERTHLQIPEDQFFSIGYVTEYNYWGGNEFKIVTHITLQRVGKELQTKTHEILYDVKKEEVVSCDPLVEFDYGNFPLLESQKTPRSW